MNTNSCLPFSLTKKSIKIGSFVPMKKPNMFLDSVQQAISFEADTLMIYTGSPTNTSRVATKDLKIPEGLTLLKKNKIHTKDLVGHAPYIINLCNPDYNKRLFAINFLTKEIVRFSEMNIPQMVLHPGNAVNKNKQEAIEWIAEGINKIFENTKNYKTKIALETMAGKGTEIGKTFEELKNIINLIHNQDRISVCFDTCHVFDAGYDIKNNFDQIIKLFDKIIGTSKITCLHINDSKNKLGSRKDRHENIGLGNIGFESIIKIIYHPFFINLPKILETPFINGKPNYKKEIKMIRKKIFIL